MRARLGQNFLHDKQVLAKIIKAADIQKSETIVEVGPGKGFMTDRLIELAGRVIVIEKDTQLAHKLQDRYQGVGLIEIVVGDVRSFAFANHPMTKDGDFRIIANIPYYLTSFLLRQIFQLDHPPSDMILMMQKEVAQRIVAKPGEMNLLALMVQFYSDPQILFTVARGAFNPPPKVESAVIRFESIYSRYPEIDFEDFFQIVKKAFGSKRKMVATTLSSRLLSRDTIHAILRSMEVDVRVRPQQLSLDQWVYMYTQIQKHYAK